MIILKVDNGLGNPKTQIAKTQKFCTEIWCQKLKFWILNGFKFYPTRKSLNSIQLQPLNHSSGLINSRKKEYVFKWSYLPDYIKQEGISKIKIQANFYKIMVYQIGWFNSESPELYYRESRKAVVSHEITNLLDYDSKPCIREANYRFDSCKEDFIYKVRIY